MAESPPTDRTDYNPRDLAASLNGPVPGLLPHHREMLVAGSGIDPEVVVERGYFSIPDSYEQARWGLVPEPTPGLAIPVHPPGAKAGDAPILVYRPDAPSDPKRKYLWPRAVPMRLDVPPRCREMLGDPTVTLYVVEGVRKVDALASRGLCAVATQGTWCFGGKPEPGLAIFDDWRAVSLNGREVRIGYDSDSARNPSVMAALRAITGFVRQRGANARWLLFPDGPGGEKWGADDWLIGRETGELEALVADPIDPLTTAQLTDVGNAERFVAANAGQAAYCVGQGWFAWHETRWRPGADRLVDRLAMHTVRELWHAAVDLPDSDPSREALMLHAHRSENRQRIDAMVALARALLLVEVDDLDRDRWLLNCANGTVDLRTGELRAHDPSDRITKLCPVPFDPAAACPTWEAFLLRAMAGSAEMVEYLQKMVGIFLTGDVSEKALWIIWGPTDTGKTTFTETIFEMVGGDYAQSMAEASIAKVDRTRGGGEATPDIARLRGVRLAVVSETSVTMQFNAARVKAMTGRNRITARNLFQNQFDFDPTHKLLIETNDKPGMRDADEATFNRVHLVPFLVAIPKAEQDRALAARFQAELPGVLAWAVRGCLAWQRDGALERPPEVASATDAYREESDPLGEFIDDWCILGPEASCTVTVLYQVYKGWARSTGDDYPYGKHQFNRLVAARGITREPRMWRGLGLKSGYATMTSGKVSGDDQKTL